MRRGALALAAALAFALPAAAENTSLVLVLDVLSGPRPGLVPEAAPHRLAVMEDGSLYVGGTSRVEAGRLEGGEWKSIQKRLERIRKAGVTGAVSLGPGDTRYVLALPKDKYEVTATGETSGAAPFLRPLAQLLDELSAFRHPSLKTYKPGFFALRAREETLPGGCRPWGFTVGVAQAVNAAQPVSGAAAADWPTGATPASVCVGEKRYVVTLRPLLPGEKP
jgi:hypothetical protein